MKWIEEKIKNAYKALKRFISNVSTHLKNNPLINIYIKGKIKPVYWIYILFGLFGLFFPFYLAFQMLDNNFYIFKFQNNINEILIPIGLSAFLFISYLPIHLGTAKLIGWVKNRNAQLKRKYVWDIRIKRTPYAINNVLLGMGILVYLILIICFLLDLKFTAFIKINYCYLIIRYVVLLIEFIVIRKTCANKT